MYRLLILMPLLLATKECKKVDPGPSIPTPEHEPEPEPEPQPEPKQVWGGVSGFKSFIIRSLDGQQQLGSFAVLMPDAAPDGKALATNFEWDSSEMLGKEAWEWSQPAWPQEGFMLQPVDGPTRGNLVDNVFEHKAFDAPPGPLATPPGSQGYRMVLDGEEVGWFSVLQQNGSLVSVSWYAKAPVTADLIHVHDGMQLRFEPANPPAGADVVSILQPKVAPPASVTAPPQN